MNHWTGDPTQEKAERIEACKRGPCICCLLMGRTRYGCEYHHMLSGGVRRGHMFGIGLCAWHHRGVLESGIWLSLMRDQLGPSLAEGSKPFHDAFGTDDELLEIQQSVLDAMGVHHEHPCGLIETIPAEPTP